MTDSTIPTSVAAALARLNTDEGNGYLSWSIPHAFDAVLEHVVESYVGSDERGRLAIRSALTHDHCQALEVYAERMASLAVHRDSPEPLISGLIAIGLASEHEYDKQLLLLLPLFWRSAERIEIDPTALFKVAVEMLGTLAPEWLGGFPDRAPALRSLAAMGYAEVDRGDDQLLYDRVA